MIIDELNVALSGRYDVERQIGQGGMATVYLARDLKHERDVALKILRPELSALIGAERFLAEIKLTANLQHQNILPLFDSGTVDGVAFYVMPFVEGESLRDRLNRDKQLSVADALRLATEAAGALDYAHRHGVIHRDIKPENILLHDGHVLVADFGIALAVGTANSRMTETGMSLGTPQYMSPEQAMGERDITARADIYALGATMYEMLVGEPPFTGPTAQAIVAKVMTSAPASITAQRHTVPVEVEAAVLTALEKLPADRFATAREFAEALRGNGGSTSVTRTVSAPISRRATRPGQVIAAGAIAGLMFLAGWLLHRAPSSTPAAFEQLTFAKQTIFAARSTPDGKTVVLSAAFGGTSPQLYVIRPGSPRPEPMQQKATQLLSISAKSELAVLVRARYYSHTFFQGTLARMPLDGGAPRELQDSVVAADWAPDGSTMAIARTLGDSVAIEYPAGTRRYVMRGFVGGLRISGDGRHIGFLRHPSPDDDRGDVMVLDTAGNKLRALTPEYVSIAGLAWTDGNRALLFSASEDGSTLRSVSAVDMKGRVRRVASGTGPLVIMDRAATGELLVVRQDDVTRLMERLPGAAADADQSWLDANVSPQISHDGAVTVFSDQSRGSSHNYTLRARGADGRFAAIGEGLPTAFSPDDKWVAARSPASERTVFIHPLGSGSTRALTFSGLEYPLAYGWYPGGRTILVCGGVAGGMQCFRSPIDRSARDAVTPVFAPATVALSPDGRLVAAGGRVYSGASDTGRVIPSLIGNVIRWAPNGRSVLVQAAPFSVSRVEIPGGRSTPVLDLTPAAGSAVVQILGISFADDPRHYVYSASESNSALFLLRAITPR